MKYSIFSFLFLLFFINSYGQADLKVKTSEIDQISDLENILRAFSYTVTNEIDIAAIDGSAYLDEEFSSGEVLLNSGVKYNGIPLRFNIYNDQIEFKGKNDQVFNINNPESLSEVKFDNHMFRYVEVESNKQPKNIFAEVLVDGHVKLFKQYRIKLQPATPAQTHKEAQAPKFVMLSSNYFIKKGNNPALPVKKENDILKVFSDKASEMKVFMTREKLSTSKENSFFKIVEFYNSLSN